MLLIFYHLERGTKFEAVSITAVNMLAHLLKLSYSYTGVSRVIEVSKFFKINRHREQGEMANSYSLW